MAVDSGDEHRALLFLALGVAASASFALLARAVARRDTAKIDREVHERTAVDDDEPVRRTAEKAAPLGKWKAYLPAAVAAGSILAAKRLRERATPQRALLAAAVPVAAAALAASLNEPFDDLLEQPPAPPGRPVDHPVFPSGHAFGTAAVALATAYVFTREDAAPKRVVLPVAVALPVASAAGRMIEEKHWLSDVIGGFVAATAVASFAIAAYEAVRSDEDAEGLTRG